MPKKGVEKDWKDSLKNTVSAVLLTHIKERTKEMVEHFVDEAQHVSHQIEKKFFENLFFVLLLVSGIIIVALAVVYFLTDSLGLPRHYGFLIIGIVVILISLIIKKQIDKAKHYAFGGEEKNG